MFKTGLFGDDQAVQLVTRQPALVTRPPEARMTSLYTMDEGLMTTTGVPIAMSANSGRFDVLRAARWHAFQLRRQRIGEIVGDHHHRAGWRQRVRLDLDRACRLKAPSRAWSRACSGAATHRPGQQQASGRLAAFAGQVLSVNYTMQDGDSALLVNATTGARAITLLSPAAALGKAIPVRKTDATANNVTLTPATALGRRRGDSCSPLQRLARC